MHIAIDLGGGHAVHPLASTAETIFEFAASRLDRKTASSRLADRLSPREWDDMEDTTFWDMRDLVLTDYITLDKLMDDLEANKEAALTKWNREWIPVFEKQFAMFRGVLKERIAQLSAP